MIVQEKLHELANVSRKPWGDAGISRLVRLDDTPFQIRPWSLRYVRELVLIFETVEGSLPKCAIRYMLGGINGSIPWFTWKAWDQSIDDGR